jgi:hypothetical protein
MPFGVRVCARGSDSTAHVLSLRANLVSFRSVSHSRRGGIGRRAGLKIQWPQGRVGSSPSAGIFIARSVFDVRPLEVRNVFLSMRPAARRSAGAPYRSYRLGAAASSGKKRFQTAS